jgi:outer membrane lipoprotein carrier protein
MDRRGIGDFRRNFYSKINMKKAVLITILLSAFCGNVFSQNGKKLSKSEKEDFELKIVDKSNEIKTLQCNFVQTKTSTLVTGMSVAKGVLLYRSPSAMRWEYTETTPSTLILNGNDAVLLDKNGKRQGNTAVPKQLGGIIISMINGESLRKSKLFAKEVFDSESVYTVVLSPVQKRLKAFYKSIELTLNKDSLLASEIVLFEKSGDKIVIQLTDIEINKEIDAAKFAIK